MSYDRKPLRALDFLGALVLFATLPPFVYYLWICATQFDGAFVLPRSWADLVDLASRVPAPTRTSVFMFVGWMLWCIGLQVLVPGRWTPGAPLEDGTRLRYKTNGWAIWWITVAAGVVGLLTGWIRPVALYDQIGPLLTTINLFVYAFCVYLFLAGRGVIDLETRDDDVDVSNAPAASDGAAAVVAGAPPRVARRERATGNTFYDYFMGAGLNPRIGSFDWKVFLGTRPGLMGWVLIDLIVAAKQSQLHGGVSAPMVLVCLFQAFYVADCYFHDDAILTTWDVRHENFGWMLCWGDLVWVPFTYSLQAFYLLHHPEPMSVFALVAITALNFAGYYLFRTANLQKHRFRSEPSRPIWGRVPTYIRTQRGTLLLTSGWWGLARHVNYLGDLMMGLAWCLLCGVRHPLPYFFIAFFTGLLVHRERRDHAQCQARYGDDWTEYCRRVPYRIIPFVY